MVGKYHSSANVTLVSNKYIRCFTQNHNALRRGRSRTSVKANYCSSSGLKTRGQMKQFASRWIHKQEVLFWDFDSTHLESDTVDGGGTNCGFFATLRHGNEMGGLMCWKQRDENVKWHPRVVSPRSFFTYRVDAIRQQIGFLLPRQLKARVDVEIRTSWSRCRQKRKIPRSEDPEDRGDCVQKIVEISSGRSWRFSGSEDSENRGASPVLSTQSRWSMTLLRIQKTAQMQLVPFTEKLVEVTMTMRTSSGSPTTTENSGDASDSGSSSSSEWWILQRC